jgi:hypothetical protein
MEIFEQFGITQRMLEAGVLFGIAATVCAIFWRYLAIGGGVLFVVFIFANHATLNAKSAVEKDGVVTAESVWHKQFMEDCQTVSMNSKDQCETIWLENKDAIEKE